MTLIKSWSNNSIDYVQLEKLVLNDTFISILFADAVHECIENSSTIISIFKSIISKEAISPIEKKLLKAIWPSILVVLKNMVNNLNISDIKLSEMESVDNWINQVFKKLLKEFSIEFLISSIKWRNMSILKEIKPNEEKTKENWDIDELGIIKYDWSEYIIIKEEYYEVNQKYNWMLVVTDLRKNIKHLIKNDWTFILIWKDEVLYPRELDEATIVEFTDNNWYWFIELWQETDTEIYLQKHNRVQNIFTVWATKFLLYSSKNWANVLSDITSWKTEKLLKIQEEIWKPFEVLWRYFCTKNHWKGLIDITDMLDHQGDNILVIEIWKGQVTASDMWGKIILKISVWETVKFKNYEIWDNTLCESNFAW